MHPVQMFNSLRNHFVSWVIYYPFHPSMALAVNRYTAHWGRVMHKCVGKLATIGSKNDLSPGRREASIQTNAGKLLIDTLGAHFSEIVSEFIHFHSRKCIWNYRPKNGGRFGSAPMCQS